MKVWWFPNTSNEPIEIETFEDDYGTIRLLSRVRAQGLGSEITFAYETRKEAIKMHLNHCKERSAFFHDRAIELGKKFNVQPF